MDCAINETSTYTGDGSASPRSALARLAPKLSLDDLPSAGKGHFTSCLTCMYNFAVAVMRPRAGTTDETGDPRWRGGEEVAGLERP